MYQNELKYLTKRRWVCEITENRKIRNLIRKKSPKSLAELEKLYKEFEGWNEDYKTLYK